MENLVSKLSTHTLLDDHVSSYFGSFTKVGQGKVVARLQAKPGFFIAQKGNKELVESIDGACNKIFAANVQYREELQDKYYGASPAYDISLTREEIEFMGPVRMKDVEEAQQKIVNIIRKLEDSGEIVISRGGGDEIIV